MESTPLRSLSLSTLSPKVSFVVWKLDNDIVNFFPLGDSRDMFFVASEEIY